MSARWLAALLALSATPASAETVAVVNAHILTMGPAGEIAKGTVVIRDGIVVAVEIDPRRAAVTRRDDATVAVTDDDGARRGRRRLALGDEIELARLRTTTGGADREALCAQVRHQRIAVAQQGCRWNDGSH